MKLLHALKCPVLTSYFNWRKDRGQFARSMFMRWKWGVFLDSGAFSADSTGEPISLPEYMEFVARYMDRFELIAALDLIPKEPSKSCVDESARVSFENYVRMKDLVPPEKLVPVLHAPEDPSWVEKYIDEGTEWMGTGGIASAVITHKRAWPAFVRKWLDVIFAKHYGKMRFHGFGVANPRMLTRLPFNTVDSSNWLFVEARGRLVHFDPLTKDLAYPQWRTFDLAKEALRAENPEKFSLPVRTDSEARSEFNIRSVNRFLRYLNDLWQGRGVDCDSGLGGFYESVRRDRDEEGLGAQAEHVQPERDGREASPDAPEEHDPEGCSGPRDSPEGDERDCGRRAPLA
jgi:hypothetical protein